MRKSSEYKFVVSSADWKRHFQEAGFLENIARVQNCRIITIRDKKIGAIFCKSAFHTKELLVSNLFFSRYKDDKNISHTFGAFWFVLNWHISLILQSSHAKYFSKHVILLLPYFHKMCRWCKIDKYLNRKASLAMRFIIGRSIGSSKIESQPELSQPDIIQICVKILSFPNQSGLYIKRFRSKLISSYWWPFSTPSTS